MLPLAQPQPGSLPAPTSDRRPPRWYTIAWLLALPFVALYLLWRSVRQSEYRQHWAERFLGHAARPSAAPGELVIWVHAVSVGETRAAQPLIERLARVHLAARFVLTHMTPTGRAAGGELVRALPGRVAQRYLPYDLPFAVNRFLRQTGASVGVLMETEVWPNLLYAAWRRRVPVVLANARLSPRSLAKALRHRELIRAASSCLAMVGAQSTADRARVLQVYDGPVEVTGNLKFDLVPDPEQLALGARLRAGLRARFGERPLWLFASTREGEERLILEALALRAAAPADGAVRPLLLFVPRHPQRFDEVAALLQGYGGAVLRRVQWDGAFLAAPAGAPPDPSAAADGAGALLLGDSMGEMALYYAMADVALIGGSLRPLGGQNLIEACACACPVVLGPNMFNFAQAAEDALAAGAAQQVRDAPQALLAMQEICRDPVRREQMRAAALAFSRVHRGATERTLALIDQALGGSSGAASAAAAR